MSMPVIPYSFPPYLTEDQQQQQQSATAYPGSQFLLQTLPPPPAPPNPVSSPIMLEQLNSSSKPDQRRGGPVTYRRLMPNGSGSPPVGNYTTNINEGIINTSPVSSPGPSVSTSPLLPTESVNRSYMDGNGVTDQGQHPLAKLQNALDHGFLGIKLFSPVGNDARPPRENHRPSTGNDEYFGPPIPVALSVASRVSPDSYQNPDEVKDTRYRCHLCEFETGSNEEYTDHMNIHFDYKCTLCDYSSRTEGRLKRHLKDFHSEIPPESWAGTRVYRGSEGGASGGESNGSNPNSQSKQRNFNCKHCGHVSKTKKDFWVHIRVHIKSEKLLACPEPSCDFVTEYKHHFEYHIRIHTGSKPFKCDQCNYSCVNKSMLNSHKKSHSNIYQYRCKDCSYATKYCHSLKLHLRKYVHQPARVLNQDGTPNPYPIIDVYGNRRGPRPKRNKDDKNKPTGTKKVHSPSNSGIVSSSVSPNSQGSSDIRGIPSIGGGISQVPPPPPPPPLVVTTNPSWLYHSHLIASLNAGMFNSSSQLIPPELRHHEARHQLCPFCNYTTDDRDLLSKHIMGHATGENVTTINPYENLDAFQQASRFDESGNRDENMTSQDDEGREDTPPPSSEMDCSSSSPARPLSSRAGTPDDLTEEYNHEDDAPPSFNDDDDEVQEVKKNDVSETLEAPPSVVEPILKTPPRSSGETSSVCPLDLSHPRNERLTKSGGNPPSSSRRRKGPAFKLTRISVQIDDEHLDGDDESENYPPSIKISQGTCSTPSGDRKPETVPSSSSRMTSPFKEINKATSASLMTSEEPSEYNQQPVAVSNRLVVEKQSPTSSSRDNPRAMGETSWKLGQVYKCNDCEISFGDCVMYTVHMGYHDYQNPFKCNMCGEESKDKVEFFLHIARTPHLYN